MRILAAQTKSAAQTPVQAYLTVLLSSVVYWLRVGAGAQKDAIPASLAESLRESMPEAESFCRSVAIPIKTFRTYVKFILAPAKLASNSSDALDEALLEHLKSLRNAMPAIRKTDVSDLELQTLTRARTWHTTENTTALEAIRAAAGKLGLPAALVNQFAVGQRDPRPLVRTLETVVKKLTGVAGTNVPLEQQADLRAAKPDLWSQYLAVRRELNVMYRQELRDFVRDRGGQATVKDTQEYFTERGLPHRLPKGFDGLVGEDGNLLTRHGKPLKTGVGGDVNNIDPAARIVMNPKYDPKLDATGGKGDGNWVFKTILPTKKAGTDRNNEQYFYTGDRHLKNRAAKFDVVDKLLDREARMVARWRRDLLGKDWENQILAAQCELVYETCARVGGKGNANRSGNTFGLTTLLVGNVKRRGTQVVLDYIGKDSAQQRHILKPETPAMRKVIAVVLGLCEDKTRKDLLWAEHGVEFNAARLRAYFRTVSGLPDASPHKLRHLRGTRLARTELEMVSEKLMRSRKGIDQRGVDTAFKDALTNVGKLLGHVKGVGSEQKTTWSTAAKNYIAPSVMDAFYSQWKAQGVRSPAWLAKLKG
jgi:hypothetical protein